VFTKSWIPSALKQTYLISTPENRKSDQVLVVEQRACVYFRQPKDIAMKSFILSIALLLTSTPLVAQACEQDGKDAPLALHKAWIMDGWERKQGDPEFIFAKKMDRYYDLKNTMGVYYDNFAPGATQLFRNAAKYGANWQELQNAARSVRHALTGGDDVIISKDIASTTLGFVGQIDRLDGKVIAFDGRSQLAWVCTDGSWKIKHELNYASVVKPEDIALYYSVKGTAQ
jgi:hypothetical protein